MRNKILIGVVVLGAAVGAFFLLGDGEAEVTNVPPKNEMIVAFGDSLVAGVGSERGGGFVSILEERTGRRVVNLGVAGETTEDALRRISEVLSHDPGVVLLLFGGNDAMQRILLAETRANLAQMITRFHESGSVVVLLGVRGGLIGDPYHAMYKELSEEYGTAYVSNVLEGILLRPELTFDQIHPNDAGYAMVADRVAPELERVLNSQTN